jgi:hypothetical protein
MFSVALSYLVAISAKSEGLLLVSFVVCLYALTGCREGEGEVADIDSILLKMVTDYKLHDVKTLPLCQIWLYEIQALSASDITGTVSNGVSA